jgi:hypothetical protein
LGGCMEAIDGGITTVVDHAHLNISGEHCKHRQSNDFFSSSDYQHPPRSRRLWPLESAPSSATVPYPIPQSRRGRRSVLHLASWVCPTGQPNNSPISPQTSLLEMGACV